MDSKDPEHLTDDAKVLGLTVWDEGDVLLWECGDSVSDLPKVITRRKVFSFSGKFTGYFPVCR